MPSQFFGLQIAGSGLRAANAALNTTANNIANSDTEGYSRQTVTQEANKALRTFTTYGCAGAGVDTIAIERVRDQFYNVKYWDNNSSYGQYEVKAYYCKSIEEYFDDDGTTGFKTLFDKMSSCLQSVSTDPSNNSTRKQFLSSVKSLTDYFNNMYGNLQNLQEDINLEIKQNVDQINSIAEQIATLNKQINVIELSGAKANELRDQRETLIDELSEIVDVDVTEYQITDPLDPSRETGGTRYIVKIAGGQSLVDASDYNTLLYTARSSSEKVNQTDVDGLYDITWSNGNEFNMLGINVDGKLKGLMQMRDGNNSSNFTGKVANVEADADGKTKVTISVSDDDLKDMKMCKLSDTGGELNISNTIYKYSSWEYDQQTETYTFTMAESADTGVPGTDKIGKSVKTSEAIGYQGIPYYMEQMNTWIRGFAEKANAIFTAGMDSYENAGCILFTGDIPTGGQYTADDLNASEGNGLYELTAGNIAVNEELFEDPGLLGTRTRLESGEVQGVEECGQVEEMIKLLTSKSMFSFRNGAANQMLEMILSDAALNASSANSFETTYSGLKTTISNQRSSDSGVDQDEEAVNLVKYQNSYTLASKMIQTLTEIYDRLILETGV